ncbi:MAG: glycosyltransferase family 2 protein [Bacteroidales bacterium]|nr:glycosyltransferase family 2 protein [Bacteroidales bacterium]
MKALEICFFAGLFILFYTYLGYGILLFSMLKAKRFFGKKRITTVGYDLPEITLLVAAYNEKEYIKSKVENSLSLNYPHEKLKLFWVTDGSDDGTPDLLKEFPQVTVLHQNERKGKIAAINRAMEFIETPIVVFSDANTMLGQESIKVIANLFADPKTGCVSGEKRVFSKQKDMAAGAGEGLYWKYESLLKKWDAELNSAVGAAGELFAIRTELYKDVEPDTLLDDFIISLRVAMDGYKIEYDPNAYAIEGPSANIKEELKRKIRIAAGGIQSIVRLAPLLNFFKYGLLSFQYISHRVLRWTIAPLMLPTILVINIFLLNDGIVYSVLFILQLLFYAMACAGWYLQSKKLNIKVLFVPYYFLMMNYAVYRGFIRYISKTQSVNWERAKRG